MLQTRAQPVRVSLVSENRHKFRLGECRTTKGKKVKTVPFSEETLLQKYSGMARVVEGFHSFTCTPTRLSTNEMNFALPAEANSHLLTWRNGRLSWPRHYKGE